MKTPHVASAAILILFVFLALGSTDTNESLETDISSGGPSIDLTDGSSVGGQNNVPAIAPVESVVARGTASQLFSDYEANEVAADEMYKGKIVVVTGTIDNIGKDILDSMYIALKSDNPIFGVQCFFSDKHKAQLAAAKKGEVVTVRGKCEGKLGNVLLKECRLVR